MEPQEITLALRDQAGSNHARIVIAGLPGRRGSIVAQPDGGAALREAAAYHYQITDVAGDVSLEPAELFDPDDGSHRQGRLLPGQSVGRLVIAVRTSSGRELRCSVEVVPSKLEQSREYRQMLEDICEYAAEAILQGFAPTNIDLMPSEAVAELLYQRFAMLEARLQSEEFATAIGRVLYQPDHKWRAETQRRPAETSYPAGSAFGRALTSPGPRRPWLTRRRSVITTVPRHLTVERHESSIDTVPNQFVKYALQRWRDIAIELIDVLDRTEASAIPGPVRRGRAAAQSVLIQLDELLSHGLFREIGQLHHLPTSNQVLLKKDGYRQLFRTFALVEAGLALAFDHPDIDDVYSASQRNVATLYEFWCYLVLAETVGRLCGQRKTAQAFVPTGDGLSLTVRAGETSKLQWRVEHRGRALDVELFFNRQFSVIHGSASQDGSWTRAMRPDCSLRIRPASALPRMAPGQMDVWIHFDAKYRIEHLADQLAPLGATEESTQAAMAEQAETRSASKREDLLKMHAYRDAIHRTAGAYILYPGDVPVRLERFAELLPGLGAFPLRPGPGGVATGIADLNGFLADVMTHVSQQASRHERHRFWDAIVYAGGGPPAPRDSRAVPFLDRPPADTDVLLGYVRGPEHRAWIERTHRYNVRADDRAGSVTLGGRELSAELLLLYEQTVGGLRMVTLAQPGPWHAADQDDLLRDGYPGPRGHLYFVTAFAPVDDPPAWLHHVEPDALRPPALRRGTPFAVSWWDLLISIMHTGVPGSEPR